MSEYEYKVGDVVEIVRDEVYSSFKGRRAVIKDIKDGEDRFPLVVRFLDDDDASAQNASEIKLVAPATPDAGESPEQSARTSDADKLRILAAVIDAQAPLGTDLADFKRRLQIVLGA